MYSKYVSLVFYAIIYCLNSIVCDNSITIETKLGSIKGSVVDFDGYKVNEFLGIPYAEPPIGNNRFRKPKSIVKYDKTVDATQSKSICFQTLHTWIKNKNESEDCLFLNIWSENQNEHKLRPVMFWIHGGGLTDGSGDLFGRIYPPYQVVLVSINYRLGPFGFLYGDDPSAPGNVGIYDQIEALKWVQNNIEHFGGDPSQVTIFGQSAGSWSVSSLIVSPLSRNLFRRAIMQSGAYYGKNFGHHQSKVYSTAAQNMSQTLGCANDSKWLDCLRKVEPKEIVKHTTIETAMVFDNELFPKSIVDSLKSGDFKLGVEVIAGVTESEATVWAVSGDFGNKLSNTSVHITKAEYETQIRKQYGYIDKATLDKIYDYYISHIDESKQTLLRKSYIAIYSDMIMKCPTYLYAENLAKFSAKNRVYFYELTYNDKYSPCYGQEWKGVCHSDDISFVFGYGSKANNPETDYEFGVMFKQWWTNFAKTGNPLSHPVSNTLGVNVTNWPTFRATDQSPVSPKVMELNPTKFGHLFNDPYRVNCDGIWKQYFGIE